jgi:DNA-binding transcriptional MerR regulator
VLELLSLISLGQAAGFSLDEIAKMFTPEKRPDIKRQMLEDKADHIDGLVRRLRAMSRGLRHAAVCPAPSHMECPSFRRLLKSATDGSLDSRLGWP